ncbi:MAG: FHA domain-containing protein [Anaerolineae bacterium]|nr:FHA domain-containing protein [Anaerolineae bacterium]
MTYKEKPIVCPSCGASNVAGILFCTECGTYLPSGGPLRTEPLPEQEIEQSARPRVEGMLEEKASATLSIEVEILTSGRKVLLSADREILIGRLDSAHGIFPELDLTTDEGIEQNVSRRHARIYTRNGACFVEDLDSTNGTFLNGERLTSYLPYAFRNGDLLTLGTLRMKVRIYSNV